MKGFESAREETGERLGLQVIRFRMDDSPRWELYSVLAGAFVLRWCSRVPWAGDCDYSGRSIA